MSTLTVTLPSYSTVTNGKQITFRTPCSSEDVTGIIVNGNMYDLVDINGNLLSSGAFTSNVMLCIVLDVDNRKAYYQGVGSGASSVSVTENKILGIKDINCIQCITSDSTITIPYNADGQIPIGAEFEIFNSGASNIDIVGENENVFFAVPNNESLTSEKQTIIEKYASIILKQVYNNVWSVQENKKWSSATVMISRW